MNETPTPEWKLPAPPEGQSWHRADWTRDMLPEGWRPLLLDEPIMRFDQCCRPKDSFGLATWQPIGGNGNTKADEIWKKVGWFLRTTRPLPTPDKWAREKAAHKAGKRIQYRTRTNNIERRWTPWIDAQSPDFLPPPLWDYRIHPDDGPTEQQLPVEPSPDATTLIVNPTDQASGEASRLDKALQVLESDSAKSFVRDLVQQSKDCHIFWDHDDPHVEIDVPGRFAVQVYDPEFSPAEVAVNPMTPPPNATAEEPRSAGEAAYKAFYPHGNYFCLVPAEHETWEAAAQAGIAFAQRGAGEVPGDLPQDPQKWVSIEGYRALARERDTLRNVSVLLTEQVEELKALLAAAKYKSVQSVTPLAPAEGKGVETQTSSDPGTHITASVEDLQDAATIEQRRSSARKPLAEVLASLVPAEDVPTQAEIEHAIKTDPVLIRVGQILDAAMPQQAPTPKETPQGWPTLETLKQTFRACRGSIGVDAAIQAVSDLCLASHNQDVKAMEYEAKNHNEAWNAACDRIKALEGKLQEALEAKEGAEKDCRTEVAKTDRIRTLCEPFTSQRAQVVEMVRDAVTQLASLKAEVERLKDVGTKTDEILDQLRPLIDRLLSLP